MGRHLPMVPPMPGLHPLGSVRFLLSLHQARPLALVDRIFRQEKQMSEINWNNFHFTCSNCNYPVEYGDESIHYKGLCPKRVVVKTSEDIMRSKWDRMRSRVSKKIFSRDGFVCVACGSTKNLTIDHIVPIKRGGNNSLSNLRTLCQSCNSKKGDRICQS